MLKKHYDYLVEPLTKKLDTEKEIIGAVVTVAYTDGTFDSRALLTNAEEDFAMNLIGDIITHTTREVLNCYLCLDTALIKLGRMIA